MKIFSLIFFDLLLIIHSIDEHSSHVFSINSTNLHEILSSNEIVLINFVRRQCRFSEDLNRILEEVSQRIPSEYRRNGTSAIVQINCDEEKILCEKYQIKKYPTLKLFRNGLMQKKEYRSSRDVSSLLKYLREQIQSNVIYFNHSDQINELDREKSLIIGEISSQSVEERRVFEKIANLLRDQCSFVLFRTNVESSKNCIYHRLSEKENFTKVIFHGNLTDENQFYYWSNEQCRQSIREITFENAEELTDEGLPFLILLHRKNDSISLNLFEHRIERELRHHRDQLNILHGDGERFLHPIKQLGKSFNDLPLILFDNFQQLILFPNFHSLSINGRLIQFIRQFSSGGFHHSAKPSEEFPTNDWKEKLVIIPSVFVHLTPSRHRYSFREEL